MKLKLSVFTLLAALTLQVSAQTNIPTFIKGTMDIKFNTKTTKPLVKGIKDVYSLNINVCNSALFHGTVTDQPQIIEGMFSKSVTQPRVVEYNFDCDVVNPKNPAQTKNVGRLFGVVPISPDGVYSYDNGSLNVDILPIGAAPGFTSKFKGSINGKPMGRPANWLDNFKGAAINLTRTVNGKVTTIIIKKYDRMAYNQAEFGAGPIQAYPSVVVSGEMLFDYDKNCWLFNNVSLTYGGHFDRLTGTIRWVKSPQYLSNGENEYQFDVRVNEPPPSENAAFAAASTEEDLFKSDTTIPSLSGAMKYKDILSGETTLSSHVEIDLVGNNLNKQQVMALTKLIILADVVPINSD